ncbi:MAG TPA: glycosyltransferase family 4 protein [Bacilli bacterium]|nr:glycosyltransferase family 4 protein [Bacilli bacterium]
MTQRKILLVVDVPGWAFEHRAKDMIAFQGDKIHFDLKYYHYVTANDQHKYDLIYAMSVGIAKTLYERGIPLNKLAAGITSMRQFNRYRLNKLTFNQEFMHFFTNLRGVNAASDEFVHKFSKFRPIHKTRVGIDATLFSPAKRKISNSIFTVGWVGRTDRDRKLKGFDLVTSSLKGLNVLLDTRTFTKNRVPREKMVEFYQGLDCFICSSASEHIPLPILEAAACGVPIITTEVGIVPELIKANKSGLIIERNAGALREAVQFLKNNPEKRTEIGKSIRQTILENWTWDVCWPEWENFFFTI